MERLQRRSGREVLLRRGLLWRDGARLEQVIAALAAEGVEHEVVEAGDVGRHVPGLRPDGRRAVWQAEAGPVLAAASLEAQAALLQRDGGRLEVGRAVREVEATPAGVRLACEDGGSVEADVAVLAPGPGAGPLLASLGVELELRPHLEQVVAPGRSRPIRGDRRLPVPRRHRDGRAAGDLRDADARPRLQDRHRRRAAAPRARRRRPHAGRAPDRRERGAGAARPAVRRAARPGRAGLLVDDAAGRPLRRRPAAGRRRDRVRRRRRGLQVLGADGAPAGRPGRGRDAGRGRGDVRRWPVARRGLATRGPRGPSCSRRRSAAWSGRARRRRRGRCRSASA